MKPYFNKVLLWRVIRPIVTVYLTIAVFAWLFADNIIFLPPPPTYPDNQELVHIPVGDEGTIAALYHHDPESRFTLLYSHGNAADLGVLKYYLSDLRYHGYSYLAYDYSGYGHSTGSPSESRSYQDVLAAYQYLVNEKKIPPQNIIAYGHSLGAAIATDLAATKEVGGLVLESPFVTAFRVQTVIPIIPFDKFDNASKAPGITAPVLILHSRDDPVIPFWHSEELATYFTTPVTTAWFDHAGHDGISFSGKPYWDTMAGFLNNLSDM